DGDLLRLGGLEGLGQARRAAGDVLGLRGLAGDLRDDVARRDVLTLDDVQVGADRDQVARLAARDSRRLAAAVLDRDAWPLVELLRVDDDLGRQPGALVDLLLHGDAFEDVAELP